MRVSGASDRVNSRQNDKHAKKGKNGRSGRGQTSAGNTGRGLAEISDRKHLTSREVERLMEATKDSRNEVRDRCLLLLMFRHGLRVSDETRPGGHRKPRAACRPVEERVIDNTTPTRRRTPGRQAHG